jgi:peptide/nickel transport system substrate-binding protein
MDQLEGRTPARFTRRSIVLGSCGLAAAALLTACGASPTPTSAPAAPTAAAATMSSTASRATSASATSSTTSTSASTSTVSQAGAAGSPAATSSAAASPAAANGGKPGGTITTAWSRYPISFNALNPVGGIERTVHQLTTARLINFDVKRNVVPDFAEKWEVSPDGTKYTFSLVKNAKWSDGQPATTKDVEFTYTWAADKRTGSTITSKMDTVKGVEDYRSGAAKSIAGITIIDDYTIQFELAQPDATFLPFITGYNGPYLIPYHILKDVPPDQFDKHEYNTKAPFVGMGPYTLTQAEKDQFLEFTRNDNYFKGKPLIDKFVYRVMQADVALAALQKGEIDLLPGVPGKSVNDVKNNAKLRLITYPTYLYNALMFNRTKPYLQDARISQAVLYAIDRKTYVDRILGGLGDVWNSVIVQPDWVASNLNQYEYNPEKAKQLLKDAGWDPNRTVEWRYYGSFQDLAPVLQQSLANIGMKITPVQMETAAWVSDVPKGGNFEFSVVGGGGILDDPDELWDYFKCDAWSRYCNQHVLDLFAQGRKAVDKSARKKTYDEIQQILNEDAPWMVLHSSVSAVGIAKRVHEVAYSSYDYLYYNQWWLDQA